MQAIVANVSDATADLFAEHEVEIVAALGTVDPADAPGLMREWRLRAEAVIADESDRPDESARSLYHSRTLDCRSVLNGAFDPEGAELIDAALRLASAHDPAATGDEVDGDRARLPAERRADALVDVCRHYLDHQRSAAGGRHRPHLNVIVDLDAVERRGPGHLIDGTPLSPATIQRLLCDCGVHRVVTRGGSQVLDFPQVVTRVAGAGAAEAAELAGQPGRRSRIRRRCGPMSGRRRGAATPSSGA